MRDFFSVVKELFDFMTKTKRWWLIPLVLLLVIVGLLILLVASSPVPIFIYPLI